MNSSQKFRHQSVLTVSTYQLYCSLESYQAEVEHNESLNRQPDVITQVNAQVGSPPVQQHWRFVKLPFLQLLVHRILSWVLRFSPSWMRTRDTIDRSVSASPIDPLPPTDVGTPLHGMRKSPVRRCERIRFAAIRSVLRLYPSIDMPRN